jgi:dihydroxy-acid dehydratase
MTNRPRRSNVVTKGVSRTVQRTQLRATGLDDDALEKPFVGVVHTHGEVSPCAMSLASLAAAAKVGIEVAGGTSREFSTVSVSDGITLDHDGASFSLMSRDLIADSVELVMRAQAYDAIVALGACDKTVPAMLMALTRLNEPGLYVHGGSMLRGWHEGREADPTLIFAYQESAEEGSYPLDRLEDFSRTAMATIGACPGQFTASSAASCAEVMGFAMLGTTTVPAVYSQRMIFARRAGRHVLRLLETGGPRPRDWVSRASLENAAAVLVATRGSSNLALHLPAIAHEAGIRFELKDMARIFREVPRITSIMPNGPHLMLDLHRLGGLPVVFKALLKAGLLDGGTPTCDGRSLAEALRGAPDPDGVVVTDCEKPFASSSGLAVLTGNLAPDGCLVKTADLDHLAFEGPARVFDGEAEATTAISAGRFEPGEVLVVRGEGPKGSPGMREMLSVAAPVRRRGMGASVAMVTDGRYVLGTGGLCVAHVSPEACEGGPIALVQDGDIIAIDAGAGTIELKVDDRELARRREVFRRGTKPYLGGIAEKYVKTVGPAHLGAVTHSGLESRLLVHPRDEGNDEQLQRSEG